LFKEYFGWRNLIEQINLDGGRGIDWAGFSGSNLNVRHNNAEGRLSYAGY